MIPGPGLESTERVTHLFIFFTQSQILSGKLQAGPTGTELGFHFPYLSKGLFKGYI